MNPQVGKDAAKLTVAKVITLAISFISAMLLSRFRTLEEYGTYSQILIVITLISSLFMLGLPNSINYFLARAEEESERRHFLSVYYSLNMILSIVMGTVLVLAIPLIEGYFNNPSIRSFAYVLAVLPWTRVTISSISNVMVVYGKTTKLMMINTTNALIALLAVVLVQLLHWSFAEYMLLYLLGESLIAFWVYHIVSQLESSMCFQLDKQLIKTIFIYSIPIGLASLVGTISIELDKLMIGYFFDTESVAIYTNAGRELPLTIVSASLTAVLLPQMARKLKNNDIDGTVSLWGVSIRLSYIIICFCATACVVFAPQIMTILYSEKYLPGVAVFRVYSILLLLRTTYFGIILNSMGKTKFIFYCSFLTLGLNLGLNYLLFITIGFLGPAIATLVSIMLTALLQIFVSAKTLKISFKNILPWRNLAQISAINSLWGLTAIIIMNQIELGTDVKSIFIAILLGIMMSLIYGMICKKKLHKLWRELNNDR